ncbi:MAG: DUF2071 domain-containing protein [Planctomycetes bacterium]|nr:DUF2071 domain-containing protein [Planctomycetota bacterium]
MLNFEVRPEILMPYVPQGTELDQWHGRTLASIVGFRFISTKVLGIPVPFHRDFDEVNLRFYVRRFEGGEWRRGVVFIKEIVPRWMISCVARRVYNENYVTMRMRHQVVPPNTEQPGRVQYEWKHLGRWNRVAATIQDKPVAIQPGSEEEFITEHYWGYTRQRDGGTMEYQVEHPIWSVWPGKNVEFDLDVKSLYGEAFVPPLTGRPTSVFVADGSAIVVRKGQRIA